MTNTVNKQIAQDVMNGDTSPTEAAGWGEAMPLVRSPEEPTKYPLDALGTILGPAAKRLHDVVRSEPAICGQSILAAVFLAVQAHRDVIIDGRQYPISQFFVTLAKSGDRKSATDSAALYEHEKYQKAQLDKYAESMKALAGSGEESSLMYPILKTDDVTLEGVFKQYINGRPSLGIFSDEGGKLIGGHAMSNENRLKTAAGFSNLWDGKPVTRLRKEGGAQMMYGRRLSMHILVQPEVADAFLNDKFVREQGFLSRVLISKPRARQESDYVAASLIDDPAMQLYYTLIRNILNEPLPIAAGKGNELEIKTLPLSSAAKKHWIAYHNDMEKWRQPEGQYGAVDWLAAKAPEHVLRISGGLALSDNLHISEAGTDYVEQGVLLMHHHLQETLRTTCQVVPSESLRTAQKLLDWLIKAKLTKFNTAMVYQKGPYEIRSKDKALAAISVLFDHNWIRPVPGKSNLWEMRPCRPV